MLTLNLGAIRIREAINDMSKKALLIYALLGTMGIIGTAVLLYCATHRTTSKVSRCNMNLRFIEQAKQRWSSEYHKTAKDTPTWDDLKYAWEFTDQSGWSNGIPVCPKGGTYSIGRVGEKAKCSIGGPGHRLY